MYTDIDIRYVRNYYTDDDVRISLSNLYVFVH